MVKCQLVKVRRSQRMNTLEIAEMDVHRVGHRGCILYTKFVLIPADFHTVAVLSRWISHYNIIFIKTCMQCESVVFKVLKSFYNSRELKL